MFPEGLPCSETPQVCLDPPGSQGSPPISLQPQSTGEAPGVEFGAPRASGPRSWGGGAVPTAGGRLGGAQACGARGALPAWPAAGVGGTSGAPSGSASFPDLGHRSGWRLLWSLCWRFSLEGLSLFSTCQSCERKEVVTHGHPAPWACTAQGPCLGGTGKSSLPARCPQTHGHAVCKKHLGPVQTRSGQQRPECSPQGWLLSRPACPRL